MASGRPKIMEKGSGHRHRFLKNEYWILRHGRSIPNENGVIVSSLENGILDEYGLASDGISQAHLAGESFLQVLKSKEADIRNVRICYSPFSRTTHTAKLVSSVLGIPFEAPQCKAMVELRERYFGPLFELQSHDKYAEIWAMDEEDPGMKPEGGDSVSEVTTRLISALKTMEREIEGCTVLIVSHGDPLQILQTFVSNAVDVSEEKEIEDDDELFSTMPPAFVMSRHRNFALNTGELRHLA